MKNWRVRAPIGAALLAAAFGLTWLDARGGGPWIVPTVAALLGFTALIEFFRMAGDAASPLVRGAVLAVAATTVAFPAAAAYGFAWAPVGIAPALYVSWAAIAAAAARLVVARRHAAVETRDLESLASAAVGLALTVVPLGALGGAAYKSPHGASGPWLVVALVLVAKMNDIGGYVVGSLVGGPKLCPGVSPGKTVSGAWGGLLFGVLGAALAWRLLPTLAPSFSFLEVLAFAVPVSAAAQLGDLCESLVKRAFGVKDSAALLPAFGGVFDLVDSFILAGPLGYALLASR